MEKFSTCKKNFSERVDIFNIPTDIFSDIVNSEISKGKKVFYLFIKTLPDVVLSQVLRESF